jgi:hypothetical protein
MAGGTLLSTTTLAGMFDQDISEQRDMRMQEQVDEFKFQHDLQQKLQALESSLSDQARSEASQGAPMYDAQKVMASADQMAQQLLSLDPGSRQSQLRSLQSEDPVMYAVVVQRLEEARTQQEAQMRAQAGGTGAVTGAPTEQGAPVGPGGM